MKFDLTDLKIFLAAVEGGSLTAAAARNNIVVAAVSARLRKMEDAFHLPLLERTGRGIKPTLAGKMLSEHARRILDGARQVEIELDEFALGRSGRVRLLSNTNMLAEHLPTALGAFLAANPDIDITVQDKPSLEVVSLLRNGEADIGIVAVSADMTGLQRYPFLADRLVAVVADQSPLIGTTDFARVLDFKLINLPQQTAIAQFLRRQANELGRNLNIRMEMDGFEATCRMVESNAGIAIIPESAALRYSRFMRFRTVRLTDPWAARELYLCVRQEVQLPGYARKLWEHLKAYAAATAVRP